MASKTLYVLTAFAAVVLAPPAFAQVPGVGLVPADLAATATPPAAPIPMETTVRAPYRIEYTIEGPHAEATVFLAPATVAPGWYAVAEPEAHVVPAGLGGTQVLEGSIALRHDGTPLAFEPEAIVFTVQASGDGYALGPMLADMAMPVSAEWRPGLYAVLPAPRLLLDERGGAEVVNAEITNTGNAPVRVATSALRGPSGCATTLADEPGTLEPGERGVLSIALDCERRWNAGSVTLRLDHALVGDASRTGKPVEPQWDIVPVDWDDVSGGGFGFNVGGSGGAARSYGDPGVSRNDASWGAVILVPLALAIAALTVRRK